jgi:hypothetical protein
MVTSSPRRAADAVSDASRSRGVVVRRPRARDAIGNALRQSFDGAAHLPDEFSRYLLQLDGVTSQH